MSYKESFASALHRLDEQLRGLRAGRASSALVEDLDVEAYGARMRLKELAHIVTPDARTIQIEPWDKELVKPIEKALATSSLGVNPVIAGTVIRVPLPPLTEERRRELAKLVKQHVEETRITIRNIRERLLKDLRARKDSGALSEDTFERERKHLQADVDAVVAEAGSSGENKERELTVL